MYHCVLCGQDYVEDNHVCTKEVEPAEQEKPTDPIIEDADEEASDDPEHAA